jgi:hypothetical protein
VDHRWDPIINMAAALRFPVGHPSDRRFQSRFTAGSGVDKSRADLSTSTRRQHEPLIRTHGRVLEPDSIGHKHAETSGRGDRLAKA